MKTLLVAVLLAVSLTACAKRDASGGWIRVADGPQLRFSGGFTATSAAPGAVHVTYKGRAIRYEQSALYVDGRQLTLPSRTRVVAFDGASIYVDGRELEAAEEQ
jgi:hypothetical protein